MFGQPGNTSFGFNTSAQSSPFGQCQSFGKPIATTSFGTTATPVFGSNNQSLFNTKPGGSTTGGLFGNTPATPAFGQPTTTQSSFGAFGTTGANTSLFGSQQTASTNLFGTSNNASAFGQTNKSTAFGGFGSSAGTGLFGQPQQNVQQATPFGQPNTTGNANLFATPAFRTGATAATGPVVGTSIKFNPVTGTDTMMKNGVQQSISTKHYCIMAMKEYENKSLEELRLEDYQNNQKGPSQAGQTSVFGAPAQASPFGNAGAIASTASGFGTMSTGFGMGNQSNTTGSLFSKPVTGFGAPATTTSSFAFSPPTSTNLFGTNAQAKPFGAAAPSTLFTNTNTNQATTGFGTMNNAQNTFSGFGATPQNQSIGLFNQKSAFNLTAATPNTGGGFGQTVPVSTSSSLFGAKPGLGTGFGTGSTFGTNQAPAFGTTTAFGTTQNTNTSTLFNTGFKPAAQNNTFPFGSTPVTSSGLGTNTALGLGTSGSLFGQQKPSNLFGNTTSGFNFNNSGTFGTSGGFGAAANTNTGLGMNLLGGGLGQASVQQYSSVPVHQQILALVSTPFGDSPLLKNLLPASGKTEELLKPTNSTSKILNSSQFKVSTANSPRVRARVVTPVQLSKKSLFAGLEEEDPTLLEAFQPRPNAKRLVLRPKRQSTPPGNLVENGNITQNNETIEGNVETSTLYSNDVETTGKENYQQINRQPADDRRSSSTSWLKSHIPRATKINEEEFDGQRSPFNTSEVLEEGLENTVAEFRTHATNTKTKAQLNNSGRQRSSNKSAGDSILLNDSSYDFDESSLPALQSETEANIANVTLRRVGYYTIPAANQLDKYVRGETCVVPNFTVGRTGYGNVYFPDSFDIYGLNLDDIVHFRHKEVIIYPDDEKKPSVGNGLNRKAQVTLDRVWPHDKNLHEPITDPDRLVAMNYEGKLRRVSAKHDTRFLEYRPETGSWVFKVDHFSKYGLSDSDDEDVDVASHQKKELDMKLKLMTDWYKKGRLPPNQKPPELKPDKAGPNEQVGEQEEKKNGEIICFPVAQHEDDDDEDEDDDDEDDDEDDHDDEESMNNEAHRDSGDKVSALSPTSIYARLVGTDSHKLQLMKASFFDGGDDGHEAYVESEVPLKRLATLDRESGLSKMSFKTTSLRSSNILNDIYSSSDQSFQDKKEKRKSQKKQERVQETMIKYFPPPIIKPVTRVLKYHCEVVPLEKSICNKLKFHTIADVSIQMGRKFKPSWGPGLTLISLSSQEQASIVPLHNSFSQIETYIAGRFVNDNTSTNIVQRLQILGGNRADRDYITIFKESIEDHLRIQLNHSVISEENGCRWIRVESGEAGIASLHDHCTLAQDIADNFTSDRLVSYTADVWKLCVALWGNLPTLRSDSNKENHDHVMTRRRAFGDWLKSVVEETVAHEVAEKSADECILSLLSANKLAEACERARMIGDYTLAVLMAQLGGSSAIKELLKQTMALWQATDILGNISLARLKVYMLIAGEQLIMYNNDIVNVCENLDWKRALALHLWYLSVPTASITDVLELYQTSFDADPSDVYAAPPLPDYKDEEFELEMNDEKKTYDLCFHLIKLYSTGIHSLEELLNPMNHTANPLDYRLSWLLQQVIVGLGYSHLSEHVATLTHTNLAAQLEAHDLWHWAIFVVLHINQSTIRKMAVIDLLSRHVKIDEDPDYVKRESFLKEELGIPIKWINEAKAIKGCATRRYGEAAWYLLQAEQWNKAHEIIIEHLAADAIINENYDYLKSLLSPLVPVECSGIVNGWSYQGQLLWDYMEITVEIESFLRRPDYSRIQYNLELLQPQLSSLCAKINQFPCPTAKLRLCQTEIAKRTLHLARSLLLLQPHEERSTTKILIRLVSQLPLPEDYAQQELRPIVNLCANEIIGH